MKSIILGIIMLSFAGIASAQQAKEPPPKMPQQPVNTAPGCLYEEGSLYNQYLLRMTGVSLDDPCNDDSYGSGSFVEYPGETEVEDSWLNYWDYDRPLPD